MQKIKIYFGINLLLSIITIFGCNPTQQNPQARDEGSLDERGEGSLDEILDKHYYTVYPIEKKSKKDLVSKIKNEITKQKLKSFHLGITNLMGYIGLVLKSDDYGVTFDVIPSEDYISGYALENPKYSNKYDFIPEKKKKYNKYVYLEYYRGNIK